MLKLQWKKLPGFEKTESGLRYQFIKEKVKKQKMVKQFLYIMLDNFLTEKFLIVHQEKKTN
jgi:hypothetical protein